MTAADTGHTRRLRCDEQSARPHHAHWKRGFLGDVFTIGKADR